MDMDKYNIWLVKLLSYYTRFFCLYPFSSHPLTIMGGAQVLVLRDSVEKIVIPNEMY